MTKPYSLPASKSIPALSPVAVLLRNSPALSAFLLSLLTLLPFAGAGLDVTDPGFHLGNQLMVGRIGLAYIIEQPYWWFSDVIGWWWLSIIESLDLGLFGARFGGILLFAICAAIAVRIVIQYILAHWMIPLSVLGVTPFFSSFLSLVSYDSVPALLYLIAIYLYMRAVFSDIQNWKIYLWSFFSGVCFFFLLLSRLPALTSLILPASIILVALIVNRSYLRRMIVVGATVYAVVFILALSFYLYLVFSGLLEAVKAHQPLDTHYTLDFVFSVIKAQWTLLSPWLWWYLIPSTAFFAMLLFRSKPWMQWALPLPAGLSLLSYGWIFSQNQLQDIFEGTLNYLLIMWLLGWSAAIVVYTLWKESDEPNRPLLFRIITIVGMAISLPVVVGAGSSAGIAKLQFGGYLIAPLATALLLLLGRLRGGRDQRTLSLYAGGLLLLSITAAYQHMLVRGIFRDNSDRQQLTGPLMAPKLAGIYTTPGRAQSVDALIVALKTRPIPSGGTVLVYREAPMVHYLIDSVPFKNWVWPDILSLDEIKRGLATICDANKAPYLVVRALEPTGNPIWGGKPQIESFAPPWQVEKYNAIDTAVATCGFRAVWKNVDFEILMRTESIN